MGIKITKRSATQLDFLKMKKHEPFSSWRGGAAKAENFSLMFGARPGVFRKLLQGSNFSVQDCKDYIKMTHSEGVYNDICAKMKDFGINVKYHHHEVGGSGQDEVEVQLAEMSKLADDTINESKNKKIAA